MVLEGCHSLHLYQLLQVSPLFSLLLLLLPPSKMFSPDGPGSIQPLWSPLPMDSSTSTPFQSSTVSKHYGTVMSKQRWRVYTPSRQIQTGGSHYRNHKSASRLQ